MDPDQTAPIGAVCSGSTLFASILDLSVMLGNYFQQTTSANNIFRCICFLGALRVNFFLSILIEHLKVQNRFHSGWFVYPVFDEVPLNGRLAYIG